MKLLVLTDGPVEGAMRGPEIRAWELARALAGRFEVTVLARVEETSRRDGVRVAPRTRRRILMETLRSDAVMAPWPPPYALLAAALRRRACVADLYDPVAEELVTVPEDRHFAEELRAARRLTRMHLRFADVLVFAGESQREAVLGWREPRGTRNGRDRAPRVAVVPMGIGGPPPPAARRPIREAFPAIGAEDRTVLWWGGLWRWLDPETAIRAVGLLADRGRPVKLVFTAGPAGERLAKLCSVEEARALATDLGLLDRHVFFYERWVPYEDRHLWLAEADAGVSLHRSVAEGRLAARARYMDYLWAGLPCAISEGGEMGTELVRVGLATAAPLGDAEAVAAALSALVDREGRPAGANGDLERLRARHDWSTASAPLAAAIEAPRRAGRGPVLGVIGEAIGFYLMRAGWRSRGALASGVSSLGRAVRRREAARA